MKYFKGYNRKTERRIFCVVYDEPQQDELFHTKPYRVEYCYMDQSGIERTNLEDFEKKFYLAREIGEAEYNLYHHIQRLITEFYMNQITGGFPSSAIPMYGRRLDRIIGEAYMEVKPKDISVAEAFANAFSTSLKSNIEATNLEEDKED